MAYRTKHSKLCTAVSVGTCQTDPVMKPREERRHSEQMSNLSKEVEKLGLCERREGRTVERESGLRRKELRRLSRKRRSSKQGL